MLLAQQRTVKGVVTSKADGQPVIGASVVVKGSPTIGGATNLDGRFTFKVPDGAQTLVVSYIGFVTQEVPIRATDMKIVLVPDSKELDAVMVVAYGTAKKSSFTGSAVAIDKKQLEKAQVADVSKALEGMVPGLQVSSSTGQPGAATTLRIRGIGSINASSAPLIILDGAPYTGDLNAINSQDIESLTILKDAASAALYGARGANGVILITTKSGKDGRLAVTFDARVGINQRGVPEYDVLTNPGEYYTLMWEALRNGQLYSGTKGMTPEKAATYASENLISELGYNIYKGVADNVVVDVNGKLTSNTAIKYEDAADFSDWAKHLYKPQMRQEYNLSVTRGVSNNNIFFSAGYLNDEGFNLSTGFERISSRISYDSQLYPWLKMAASTQFSHTKLKNQMTEQNNFSNTFAWTRMIAPIYPVYKHDADGRIMYKNGKPEYDGGEVRAGINGKRAYSTLNIVEQQQRNRTLVEKTALIQNMRADVNLPWDLAFNTTATYSSIWDKTIAYYNPEVGDGLTYNGLLGRYHERDESLNWNQVLSWNRKFDDLSLQVLLGHESFMQTLTFDHAEKTDLIDPNSMHFKSANKFRDLVSWDRKYRLEGYFGQVTADYADKYYLSASLRRDGSSIFAPDKRWGTFWSVGGSWRIKEESFLKGVKAINNLKLRASYGLQGNDFLFLPGKNPPVRAYTPYEDLYEFTSDGNSASLKGVYKGNRDITWEKNANLNVGLEFSLFNGYLSGEIDFFNRTTSDMLFNLPTPSTTGFSTKPVNVGSMTNTGWEFSLNSNVYRSQKVSVTLGVNGTTYVNTVLDLPEDFKENGITQGNRIIKQNGSIYDYYLVPFAGVDPKNGDALYTVYDKDTKKYVQKNQKGYTSDLKSRKFAGSAIPKLTGGFYANTRVYDFDFSIQFAYRLGGYVYNSAYSSLMSSGNAGTNWHVDIRDRWTPENTNSKIPRLDVTLQGVSSDRFLQDGSYLSLRNVSLGYNLPKSALEKVRLKSARVYFAADNVALWSKLKGFDPRLMISGDQSYSVNSAIRTLSLGLNVGL